MGLFSRLFNTSQEEDSFSQEELELIQRLEHNQILLDFGDELYHYFTDDDFNELKLALPRSSPFRKSNWRITSYPHVIKCYSLHVFSNGIYLRVPQNYGGNILEKMYGDDSDILSAYLPERSIVFREKGMENLPVNRHILCAVTNILTRRLKEIHQLNIEGPFSGKINGNIKSWVDITVNVDLLKSELEASLSKW